MEVSISYRGHRFHKSRSTHRLLDPILESPFSLLEVVLALVHCSKVAVVCEHLQYGDGVNEVENPGAADTDVDATSMGTLINSKPSAYCQSLHLQQPLGGHR